MFGLGRKVRTKKMPETTVFCCDKDAQRFRNAKATSMVAQRWG